MKTKRVLIALIAISMGFQLSAADSEDAGKRKREEAESTEERSAKRALTDQAELADRLYKVSETFKSQVDDWNYDKVELLHEYQKPEYAHILKIIKAASPLKIAEELTGQDLQETAKQYLNAIDDLKIRKDTALELLQNASFLQIDPIKQTAVEAVAAYLKTEDVLDAFNQGPPSFIETEFSQLANRPGWQEMISTELLEPFKDALISTTTLPAPKVYSLAYSPDGKYLASASIDGLIRLWDPCKDKLIHTMQSPVNKNEREWPFPMIAFSPEGNYLAAAFNHPRVALWNPETGELIHMLENDDPARAVAFSYDGKQLATAAREIMLWDPESGELIRTLENEYRHYFITEIAYSPDSIRLASAQEQDYRVELWDRNSGEPLYTIIVPGYDAHVSISGFSPDGKQLALSFDYYDDEEKYHRNTWLCNSENGAIMHKIQEESFGVYSPNGKQFASRGNEHSDTVNIWNPETGELINSIKGLGKWIIKIVFSPDSTLLALAPRSGPIWLWSTETESLIDTFEVKDVQHMSFSPDSKQFAATSYDGNVRLWDLVDFNKDIIRRINLEQAIYIYYRLQETITRQQLLTTSSAVDFRPLYNSLPETIKRKFSSEEDRIEQHEQYAQQLENALFQKIVQEYPQTYPEEILDVEMYEKEEAMKKPWLFGSESDDDMALG